MQAVMLSLRVQARPVSLLSPRSKPPQIQKTETAVAGDDEEGSKEVVVAVAPKSRLKRANCANSKNVVKGNVKWIDLLGKDLTEVKEFAPRVTRRQSWSTAVTGRWLNAKSWFIGSRMLEETVGLELGRVKIKDG